MKFNWNVIETVESFELAAKASANHKTLDTSRLENTLHNHVTLDTSRLENTLHNYRLVEIENQYQFQNTLHNYETLDMSRLENTLHNYGASHE